MVELYTTSSEALFRFQVVSAVLARVRGGAKLKDAVADVKGLDHVDFNGRTRLVGKRTLYRWVEAFRERGFAGLEWARRTPPPETALPTDFVTFVVDQKQKDPRASVPELIRRARVAGILPDDQVIDRVTVWRALDRRGVATKRQKKPHDGDTRRFAYPNRMMMLLSDGKHFRAGKARLKRVALFFLDDATRYGLHVIVGTSESTELFLRGVYEMVRKGGLFEMLFLDRGPGFRSTDTAAVVAALNGLLILGTAAYPAGHGKIEKFNQTALNAVLQYLDGADDVDPDCGALELRLQHWLREIYNHTPHESLGKDVTPWQRWSGDERPLTLPTDDAALRGMFVIRESRQATNDHTVPLDGVDYEVPKGLARQRLELLRHVLDGSVWVQIGERPVRLHPVDLAANATSRRGAGPPPPEPPGPVPPSAAQMAFARDLAPIVGPDGGFADPNANEED
jgi:transposase InsO family protein